MEARTFEPRARTEWELIGASLPSDAVLYPEVVLGITAAAALNAPPTVTGLNSIASEDSDVDLISDLDRIVDFDAEVSHCALYLRVNYKK
mgnify:CR=1 FL=1